MKSIMSKPARPYIRMNGAGNAFIVVQAFEQPFHPTADQVRALAAPAAGLGGFDQLIGVEPSETADAFMRVWNADGSMVQTCGNALRCVGWLMLEATDKEEVVIDTLSGPTTARRAASSSRPRRVGRSRRVDDRGPASSHGGYGRAASGVGSGAPVRRDGHARHRASGRTDRRARTAHPRRRFDGQSHVVFFTDRQDDAFVRGSGSLVERHPLFPEGVNVGFAHVLSPDHIRLRVWERGAGLTWPAAPAPAPPWWPPRLTGRRPW